MTSITTDRITGLGGDVAVKAPCRVATTTAITLSGLQTIDSEVLAEDDRVLVKDQANSVDNGIYVVSSTAWSRALDFDGSRDIVNGTLVMVTEGSDPGRIWKTDVTDNPVVIDTSDIDFSHAEIISTVPTANETTEGALEVSSTGEMTAGTADDKIVTPLKLAGSKYNPIGKHAICIPASGWAPATTNGAATGQIETTTNKRNSRVLDFDSSTQEFASVDWVMPESWDEGTVTFKARWTAASGSGGVAWALQGIATSDDDAMDQAHGTEQVVTDTLITANDDHNTAESAAITIAGTPQAGDLVNFRIKRVPANGSDTLAVDARLIAVTIYLTTTTGTDA